MLPVSNKIRLITSQNVRKTLGESQSESCFPTPDAPDSGHFGGRGTEFSQCLREPRLVAGGGVAVQNAFGHHLVDGFLDIGIGFRSNAGIALLQQGAILLDCGPHTGAQSAVARRALDGLTDAFFRRLMVCHCVRAFGLKCPLGFPERCSKSVGQVFDGERLVLRLMHCNHVKARLQVFQMMPADATFTGVVGEATEFGAFIQGRYRR